MKEVKIVVDVHQGYTFDIRVFHAPAGYTYSLSILQPPDDPLEIHSGDDLFADIDQAKHVARSRAWDVINSLKKAGEE